ncbi:MAG: accessory gene regulator B family protein [Bacillus sp. (in: Bacteria)]|nr:accessory gene regulator B family protein [Bacillus sp. (in: firmicutes)]MCM1426142.1 accessory gene regulator B family protein [Eubacterium sp.]
MDYLMNKVQSEYGFSDYQIKLLRFSFTGILYDVSKTLIFFVYFLAVGKLPEFLFAVVPLILLRTRSGGIHFRKYWTCFLASFLYLCAVIYILPNMIAVHPLVIYLILLLCAVLDYMIGSASLKQSPVLQDEFMISQKNKFMKKAKIQSFQVVFIIAVLFYIFPDSRYIIISFWTVVLHTLQLSITKTLKEVKHHEKLA